MVYENKEGLCGSSRRLIGHQEAGALSGLTGADVVHEPIVQPYEIRDCAFRGPVGNLIRINELR